MKTLLSRISRLVGACGQQVVNRGEDSQAVSLQLVRDLTAELAAANRALVAAVAAQRQLQRNREHMEQEAADWDRTAEVLLRKGEEGMTREALLRGIELRQGSAALAQPLQRAAGVVERRREQIEHLRAELGQARRRVAGIVPHLAADGELQHKTDSERCERKVAWSGCRAETVAELLEAQDRLPRSAAALGATAAVEEAFVALRGRIAGGPDRSEWVSASR
jgi:phage shock protein A